MILGSNLEAQYVAGLDAWKHTEIVLDRGAEADAVLPVESDGRSRAEIARIDAAVNGAEVEIARNHNVLSVSLCAEFQGFEKIVGQHGAIRVYGYPDHSDDVLEVHGIGKAQEVGLVHRSYLIIAVQLAAGHFLDFRHIAYAVRRLASGIDAAVRVVGILRGIVASLRIEFRIGIAA